MSNEGVGLVRADKVTKISETDKRGCVILASRFSELIRRKLASYGKVTIRLYILGKDRRTNVTYLVPVSFTVNLENKSTEMILDENRL